MDGVTKTIALAVTTVSAAVILIISFAWFGPGLEAVTPEASAALFNEDLVQDIYQRVGPAVVEVRVDLQRSESFGRLGSGSGFLVDGEGHIVTNNHIIEDADRVRVSFQNGKSAEAEVLGTNPGNDIALLKVDSAVVEGIEPVPLGDSSQARPGQLAIAIGRPFGLEGSVTVGVVSGVGRTLDSDLSRPIAGVVQTDALISPGNSGGPLLNSSGQALGINTAIRMSTSQLSFENILRPSIGFAVPINTLTNLLPRLKEKGVIRPAWLGIGAAGLDELLAERLELPITKGVYVSQVTPDSPADLAGLVSSSTDSRGRTSGGGDVIVGVNGASVDSVAALISQLNKHLPGDEITLTVIRDGEEVEIQVTLGEWPEDQVVSQRSRRLPQPDSNGDRLPGNPPIPFIPGFPFPDLFPDNPRR